MVFSSAAYEPALLELMSRAFDDAGRELSCVAAIDPHCDAAQAMMALRLMTAVTSGERDLDRLRFLALQAIDGRR